MVKGIDIKGQTRASAFFENIGYKLPVPNQWMILYIDSNTVHSWDVNPQP